MRTAFSEVPTKRVIFRVCLTQRKNSSIAHRRLYRSAMTWAGAVRSLVTIRRILPLSIMTRCSRIVERVPAVVGLTLGEGADAVGEDVVAVRYGLLLSDGNRRVALEPGHRRRRA